MIAVYFIPTFLLHTVLLLTNKYNKFTLVLAYSQSIFFVLLSLFGQLFPNIKSKFNSFYYVEGNALFFASFLLWLAIAFVALLILFIYYQNPPEGEKRPIFFFIFAAIGGFVGGTMNFLPCFNINIYPYGNFLIPFYVVIMTYVILKYQFLEIIIVIKKSIIYSILIASISLLYLMLVVSLEKLTQ